MNENRHTADTSAFQGRRAYSRRHALAGILALGLAPASVVAAVAAPTSPDQSLLDLSPRLESAIARWLSLDGCTEAEVNERSDELEAVALDVARYPARTLDGMAIKIRALQAWYFELSRDPQKVWEAPGNCEIADDLMFSICADAALVQGSPA